MWIALFRLLALLFCIIYCSGLSQAFLHVIKRPKGTIISFNLFHELHANKTAAVGYDLCKHRVCFNSIYFNSLKAFLRRFILCYKHALKKKKKAA
jgi:hypothetical protein